MRIDAHQHYWSLARGDYGWLTPALAPIYRDFLPPDLQPLLDAAKIDRTILVQAAPTEAETAFMLDLAAKTPSVAGVVGWVDFENPDAPARIAELARDPYLVGLRPMIHDIPDPEWMLRPDVAQALAALQAKGLVFDALVRPEHLQPLLVLARRFPDLSIVIDHGAKPDIRQGLMQPWADHMAALAQCRNVHAKLSGLVTEAGASWSRDDLAPHIELLLREFAPYRLIFGSDWPVLNLAGNYRGWVETVEGFIAALEPSARKAIMGGNAARLYLKEQISC